MRVVRQGGSGYIYVAAVDDDLIQPTMACQRRSADPSLYPERARCNGQADEEQGAGLASLGRIIFAVLLLLCFPSYLGYCLCVVVLACHLLVRYPP
jgi:hypothetical protein